MIKKRLIELLSDSKKYIVHQVLWQWLSLIVQIAVVFSFARILEGMYFQIIDPRLMLLLSGVIIAGIGLRYFFDKKAVYASYHASADVKYILRERIYNKLLKLGASYNKSVNTASIVQMAVEGVEQLEIYFGKYLAQLFYSLLAPLTLFVVLSFVNLRAALVLLFCVPLIPLSIVFVQKIAKRLLNKYWGIYTGLGDSFLENLQGLTTLKIYRADEASAERMDEESEKFRKATMRVLTMQLNSTSVMDIIAYGGAGIGMITVIVQLADGRVSLAGAIIIILLASEFFIPLRLLGSFFHIAMNGMAASDKIFAFLDLPEPAERKNKISGEHIDISMKDVRFGYTKEREILKGISIDCNSGSFISIVGVSGSGKSTIAKLLMGKNDGYEGSITVNGEELNAIDESSLMKNITGVSYNSYLFKGSVAYNLRMAKPDATEEEMKLVLDRVNLLGFLEAQEGIETLIHENSSNLSGGQRQRLSLARALLHDSPVYIFDEATSNIDAESEEIIMQTVHELAKSKTVILISHRLANVVRSDRIYMLSGGEIVQSGTHSELIAAGGAYKTLFEYQKALEEFSPKKKASFSTAGQNEEGSEKASILRETVKEAQ